MPMVQAELKKVIAQVHQSENGHNERWQKDRWNSHVIPRDQQGKSRLRIKTKNTILKMLKINQCTYLKRQNQCK